MRVPVIAPMIASVVSLRQSLYQPLCPGREGWFMALTTMPSRPGISVHDSSHCSALSRSLVMGHSVHWAVSRRSAKRFPAGGGAGGTGGAAARYRPAAGRRRRKRAGSETPERGEA